ncbi:MAG TPA: pitrilysin family protein [Pyrinomonadaceae bacterium]|nr:pitrilysin family protein [Pyrinomonadaceae bacterium]
MRTASDMNNKRFPSTILVAFLALFLLFGQTSAFAQTVEPQREQLLNGLRILLVTRPGDQNVLLKLRVHSGSAFDMAGKNGTMSLLADSLFPDPVTFDYFKEEINGRLEVDADQDAIDITLQGRAAEYDRIVDTLRAALVMTPLSPENVNKVRDARIKKLAEHKPSASELADLRIAERLFGNFPYANDPNGTAESLGRIDRADLLLARDRFLSPNNSTLVIIGGVDHNKAMRALRQLLGGWRKAEEVVPSSFRQPTAPDSRTLIANQPDSQTSELRLAVRGLARGDRDYAAASVLAKVVRERWQKLVANGKVSVRHEAHTLPGIFVMGASVENTAVAKALESGREVLKALVASPVLPEEIDRAKRDYLASREKMTADDLLANAWLDTEAYSLPPVNDQLRAWNNLSAADLQRVAIRLFKNATVASVAVGNADNLRAQLPAANSEVLGEAQLKPVDPKPGQTAEQPIKHKPFVFTPKPSPLLKSQKPKPQP